MMREADHLRRELIKARGLLADAQGLIRVLGGETPLPVTERVLHDIKMFQTRPVAVLPPGVRP